MMKLINPTQQTAERGKQTTLTPQTVKLVFFFLFYFIYLPAAVQWCYDWLQLDTEVMN